MLYKTPGIVIRRQDFAEADRILTILTERFGKVKAIARGVRKITAKLAGNLEPFQLIDLQLHEGKTFYTVTGAVIQLDSTEVQKGTEKIASLCFAGELVDKFIKEDEKAGEVFALLLKLVKSLEKQPADLPLLAFEVQLLKINGHWGDLAECLHCKAKLTPGDNCWDGEEGGIICGKCQKVYHHGQSVSDNLIKLLRWLETDQAFAGNRLKLPIDLIKEVQLILSIYIKEILECSIKSEHFLHNQT